MRILLGALVVVAAVVAVAISLRTGTNPSGLQAAAFPSTVLLRPGDSVDVEGRLQQQSGTDDGYPASDEIGLLVARGEVESAQVLVTGPETTTVDVEVVMPRMDGLELGGGSVRVHRALVGNLPKASDMDLEGATGPWWDALLPEIDTLSGEERNAFPIGLGDAGGAVLVWLDVAVPAAASPGRYEGELRIHGEGAGTIRLPLIVDVADILLPARPSLPTAWDLNANVPCEAHGCADEREARQLHNRYVRMLGQYRIATARPFFDTPDAPERVRDLKELVAPWQAPDEMGPTPGVEPAPRYPEDGSVLTDSVVYGWCAECMDDYRSSFRQAGLTLDLIFHCDEMGRTPTLWHECSQTWKVAQQKWTQSGGKLPMPFQVTADTDDLDWASRQGGDIAAAAGAVTRLVPLVNHIAGSGEDPLLRYARFRIGGGEVWSYASCESHGCGDNPRERHRDRAGWPQYVLDSHPSQLIAMPWLAFQWSLDGEYHYDTVRDLPTAFAGTYADGGALDGTLLYPGLPNGAGGLPAIGGTTHIPLGSIRLARIRDGHEQYELLVLAEEAQPAAGRRYAHEVFSSAQDVILDSEQLAAARRQLIEKAGHGTPLF